VSKDGATGHKGLATGWMFGRLLSNGSSGGTNRVRGPKPGRNVLPNVLRVKSGSSVGESAAVVTSWSSVC